MCRLRIKLAEVSSVAGTARFFLAEVESHRVKGRIKPMTDEFDQTASSDGRGGISPFIAISLLLSALGLLASLYAVNHHIDVKMTGSSDAICNINDQFNCDDVARSPYSEILGTPVAVYGAGYFFGLLILLGVGIGKPEYRRDTTLTYGFSSIVGVLVCLVFGGISFFVIQRFCPSCMAIYAICFLQLVVTFFFRQQLPEKPWGIKSIGNGSTYLLLALAISIGAYQFLQPTPHDFQRDLPQSGMKKFHQQSNQENQTILDYQEASFRIDRSPYAGYGEDYRKGDDSAKVTIVEFADFQCPACRRASGQLKQLQQEYGNTISIVFKNFPIDKDCNPNVSREVHQHACSAAILARCAGRYGKFWEMHDRIFANQSNLSQEKLAELGKEVGLSDDQMAECNTSVDILNKIKEDIKQGQDAGVSGTPTLFMNKRKIIGNDRSLEAMKREIDRLLRE